MYASSSVPFWSFPLQYFPAYSGDVVTLCLCSHLWFLFYHLLPWNEVQPSRIRSDYKHYMLCVIYWLVCRTSMIFFLSTFQVREGKWEVNLKGETILTFTSSTCIWSWNPCFVLTLLWNYMWSIVEQTHHKTETICKLYTYMLF